MYALRFTFLKDADKMVLLRQAMQYQTDVMTQVWSFDWRLGTVNEYVDGLLQE